MNSGELALVAGSASVLATPPARALLRRRRVLDWPSARSSHTRPILRGGGVAPAGGCVLAVALSGLATADKLTLAVAAACFGALGLADDLSSIPPLWRLAAQVLLAAGTLAFVAAGFGHAIFAKAVVVVLVGIWLVGFVNAFNFMDGINGIALAQAVVAGAAWWAAGSATHVAVAAVTGASAVGACLAFLPMNFPRARMFLGDVGSYFLGAWLGLGAVLAVRAGLAPEAVFAPLAVFVADAAWTLSSRIRRHERWLQPHRSHAYQRLVQAGWSHTKTTLFASAVMVACSAAGSLSLTGYLAARVLGDLAVLVLVAGYLSAPEMVRRRRDLPMAVSG